MKIFKLLTLISSSLFLSVHLQSCVFDPNDDPPCADTKSETRNLSAADLSKVPYSGFDTLYFLNKQGDTCIVRGTGKQFSYEIAETQGNPACSYPAYRYSNQLYSIQFVPVKGDLSFNLMHKYDPRTIYIDRGESYSVKFQSESNIIGIEYPGSPYYIDSITINAIKYGRVSVCLPRVKDIIKQNDTTYTLLFNMTNGILLIQSKKENEEFSIIPKP